MHPLGLSIALGLGAALVSLVLLVRAVVSYNVSQRQVTRFLDPALSGQVKEAKRILETSGPRLAPLAAAMEGKLIGPAAQQRLRDSLALTLIAIVTVLFFAVAWFVIFRVRPDLRVEAIISFVAGLVVLIPLSTCAAYAILTLNLEINRVVRGAAITLIARQVETNAALERVDEKRKFSPSQATS